MSVANPGFPREGSNTRGGLVSTWIHHWMFMYIFNVNHIQLEGSNLNSSGGSPSEQIWPGLG